MGILLLEGSKYRYIMSHINNERTRNIEMHINRILINT